MDNKYNTDRIQEKKRMNPPKRILHLLGVIVIVAVFVGIFGTMSIKTGIYALDGGIELEDPSGNTYRIIYEDISELELISLPENYGTCIDGANEKGFSYGLWENDIWGQYILCIKNDMEEAIWIRQQDEILIFNYEGSQPTKSFYEALQKKLQYK